MNCSNCYRRPGIPSRNVLIPLGCNGQINYYTTTRYSVPRPNDQSVPFDICTESICECENIRRSEKNILEAATIGQKSIDANSPVLFESNTIVEGRGIKHVTGESTFNVIDGGLYEISYKVAFETDQPGTISFVLRLNGLDVATSLTTATVTANTLTTLSNTFIIELPENSVFDLFMSANNNIQEVVTLDPIIVIRRL